MKILGKNNNLLTEEGKITKQGHAALALSSVFGFGLFLIGRYLYGKKVNKS